MAKDTEQPGWWKRIAKSAWFGAAIIILLTAAAYLPALGAGFIWDDDAHLTRNECIIGPLGFREIWISTRAYYYPLVLTSFWVLHKLTGLNPFPYHLLSVLMHAGSAAVLWRVLLSLRIRGAWLGAALWGLHPVMVQSVAWITELKNTQSCFFYLLSILFFLKADLPSSSNYGMAGPPSSMIAADRRKWHIALSLLLFAMAITSKPSTVMLPVVLALCLWWRGGRLRWRGLAALAPFLLISVAASGWTIWEQKFHSGALGIEWAQTWPQRVAVAGWDIWFYLSKLVWPNPLIFIYPRWNIETAKLITFLPTLAAVGALFLLWFMGNGRLRAVFFAAAYFVISLFPVLGFFDVYFFRYSFVSDHFQYLASIGPLALGASGVVTILSSLEKPWLQTALCGTLLLTLGALTWRQTAIYHDIETLWRTTIARNPECWLAHLNLGVTLKEHGKTEEALTEYREALKLNPDYAEALNNLGVIQLENGQVEEAIESFKAARKSYPAYAFASYNLGSALVANGQLEEAIASYKDALRVNPDYTEAHNNLGIAFLKDGQIDEAIAHCEKALQIKPDYPEAHNNLGNAFLHKGELNEAIVHFLRALEIKPGYAEAHNNLGLAFLSKGEVDEAIGSFQKAVRIKPDYAEAHSNLGGAFSIKGEVIEGITCYEKALEINPNYAEAHYNLGFVLASQRKFEDAIAHYVEVLRLNARNPAAHFQLGRALVELGRREEAVSHLKEALRLKPDYVEARRLLRALGADVPQ